MGCPRTPRFMAKGGPGRRSQALCPNRVKVLRSSRFRPFRVMRLPNPESVTRPVQAVPAVLLPRAAFHSCPPPSQTVGVVCSCRQLKLSRVCESFAGAFVGGFQANVPDGPIPDRDMANLGLANFTRPSRRTTRAWTSRRKDAG